MLFNTNNLKNPPLKGNRTLLDHLFLWPLKTPFTQSLEREKGWAKGFHKRWVGASFKALKGFFGRGLTCVDGPHLSVFKDGFHRVAMVVRVTGSKLWLDTT